MAPMFRAVQHDFFKYWSPEMAYVLGYFAADGTMIRNNRGAHFIEFHSTDKRLVIDVKTVLRSEHHIGVRVPSEKYQNHKIAYRLQIGSKEMFADLRKLGFTQNKSNVIEFPTVPERYFGDFVRGYFDGDGNVYFKKHHVKDRKKTKWIFTSRFTCGSLIFLESLLKSLRARGIHGGFITSKSGGSGYDLVLSHHDSVALFHLMYDTVPDGDLRLMRKYDLFRKALRTLYGEKMRP